MSKYLLIAEASSKINELAAFITGKGFDIDWVHKLEASREKLSPEPHLLLIYKDKQGSQVYDFIRDLRKNPKLGYMPIILLADHPSDELIQIGIDSGADDVVDLSGPKENILSIIKARGRVKSSLDLLVSKIEKTREEMDMARKVQEKLLPARLPNNDKVRFAAMYQPAEGVGGDFYDVISHEDDSIGLFISDVSGHGIHAAFTTMSIKTALNTWARGIVSPSETFILINNLVLGIVDVGRFVTAYYAKIDLDTLQFAYSNAGHPPALLFRDQNPEPIKLDTETGLPLGISSQSVYQEKLVQLKSGDKIFLYTDGIDEARNPKNEIYGETRFYKTISDNINKSVGEIISAVMADVKNFADGTVFYDDINILAMEVI